MTAALLMLAWLGRIWIVSWRRKAQKSPASIFTTKLSEVLMAEELSTWRLYSMQLLYLLTFVGLAPSAWSEIINHGVWDPLHGVAISFWVALSTLAVLGVLYPLKMLPLLVLQLSYKAIWLLGVGLPLWSTGHADSTTNDLIMANSIGVVLDIVIIPWIYLFKIHFGKIEFRKKVA